MKASLAFVLALLALSACKKPEAPRPITTDSAASSPAAAESARRAILQVSYQCGSHGLVQARYDNSDVLQPRAELTIGGKTYSLYAVPTASGASYATEQGLRPEQGMRWRTQGREAFMESMTLDHTAKPEDETILFNCTQAA